VTVWPRLVVAACFISATQAFLHSGGRADQRLAAPQLDDLKVRNARVLQDAFMDPDDQRVVQADQYLLRTFERSRIPMTVFVAYYATQRSGHTTHSPLNCLPGTGWTWEERTQQHVEVGPGQTIDINRNVATRPVAAAGSGRGSGSVERILIYYWYQSRGRVVADEYRNKLLLVHDALFMRRSDGALVRVTMPVRTSESADGRLADEGAAFIRDLYPSLTNRLPG
jgi:EpsI family protein